MRNIFLSQIEGFIYTFITLLGIDLLSLIFSAAFLKYNLNINLFQVTLSFNTNFSFICTKISDTTAVMKYLLAL